MNLLLHIPPELEALLARQAKSSGKAPEDIALRVLKEQLACEALSTASPMTEELAAEEWISDVRSWVEGRRKLDREADDSRESIYAGRGE